MKVTVLGNCAGQTAEYETTNFLIDSGETKVLLDAGPGVVAQLYRAGITMLDIEAVVLTHSHGDHTLGFPYYAFNCFAERLSGGSGPSKIPIIALREVFEGVNNMLAFCYPPGKFPGFAFENWEVPSDSLSEFVIKDVTIKTTPVSHVVPNIGVRFEVGAKSVTFSSDTVYDERLVALAKGSRVLVHEAFALGEMGEMASRTKHSTAEEAGRAAKAAGVGKLILAHPLPQYRSKKNELIAEARTRFDGEILLPSELETIIID